MTGRARVAPFGPKDTLPAARYQLMFRGKGWALYRDGGARAVRLFTSHGEAMRYALSHKLTPLYLHRRDGTVQHVITR